MKKKEIEPTPPATTTEMVEIPADEKKSFPVVGIGASAGGLAAFEAFFQGMPKETDPGMAFILVQHLAPDHKSMLTELISRYTRMKVFEVEDGMKVEPNCIYIIPPNRDLAFLGGHLQLLEMESPRGQRLPIDYFFRSLALDQHALAIGIILSGTGSDGTLGVRAIKGEGGMVMVQNPESTEFDGMPRSAIATGLVDFQIPPSEMASQLIKYASHAFGKLPSQLNTSAPHTENAMRKIFILLRNQSGHDFSRYKYSTIDRRIERRMAVHQIDSIDNYIKYLQQTPNEINELFHDLLIGVTNFFRDPESFWILEEQVIPKMFAEKPPGSVIRVWSAGCSTGEEAYSIAILLQEHMEKLKLSFLVQVFATDIDSRAIATARTGIYPASISGDISKERFARFFTPEPDRNYYRIHKSIRDMLIFSEQNVIKDPPFSKLDLLSCRNLLIYFNADLQKQLIPLFHYALNPEGVLMLGTSEGIGEFGELFSTIDKKAKLFLRKIDPFDKNRTAIGNFPTRNMATAFSKPESSAPTLISKKYSLREITEQSILGQLTTVSALVNAKGDIHYLFGRFGMYLEPTSGEAGINNIFKMAREGLKTSLVSALHRVLETKEKVVVRNLKVKTNGHFVMVNLSVSCVILASMDISEAFYLVMLEEDTTTVLPVDLNAITTLDIGADAEKEIAALKQELRAKNEYLQITQEELESSTEELKSSNEEMQSVNEELQSTNEELETSKEELQSLNEELATVNTELQTKVADLSIINNDMNNLLAGTGIATVFVDPRLHILRFTPAANKIINLIAADVGRPVGHIVSNLKDYDELVSDVQAVYNTLMTKRKDVQTLDGSWYSLHIQPYRTLENIIEGIVISFVDITETVKIREDLARSQSLLRLAVVIRDANDAITVQNLDGNILAWNPGAERLYGFSEKEALTMKVQDRIPFALRAKALDTLRRLSEAEIIESYHTERLTKNGKVVKVSIISTALVDETGHMYAIATTERALKEGNT